MGTTFSNLHIKKNDSFTLEDFKKLFIDSMAKKGYKLAESKEQGEAAGAIYAPEDSGWISLSCDDSFFGDDVQMKEAAEPWSKAFSTDVIAAYCCDSDFMFLNLINTPKNKDGWITLGFPYGDAARSSSFEPWEEAVGDLERFKEIMQGENVFAEDAFITAGEQLLGMTAMQCDLTPEHTQHLDQSALTLLYFVLSQEEAESAPPKLDVSQFTLMPCKIGESSCVFAVNKGGASVGVAVEFFGDFTENDEITFENVTFEYDYGSDHRGIVPITLKKTKSTDGRVIWYWEDKSFKIPPKVNPKLPTMKILQLEFEREFGVRFTPK
ncbi:MAG: hypothetical protein NC203_11870, partial [Firmicutes bacterium]|nr:hypothetical protein [Bacillota bacterium]